MTVIGFVFVFDNVEVGVDPDDGAGVGIGREGTAEAGAEDGAEEVFVDFDRKKDIVRVLPNKLPFSFTSLSFLSFTSFPFTALSEVAFAPAVSGTDAGADSDGRSPSSVMSTLLLPLPLLPFFPLSLPAVRCPELLMDSGTGSRVCTAKYSASAEESNTFA